ncbi:hypothetical protein [Novosphingopyxis sp. YJ-S2-01]|uniref:hypothetical protein n=1 Tax=Novosphingopyxis sp. YJ-S2-01 TaxID=2794021 RepID=UPI0018DDCE6B|nr:hypothetical protein [Novosphingopyxis sp. YJ-S2-01]MBH9537062.1 hypothetical protein [Novosphingopyxis sp. YJ-S2-01]
MTKKLAPPFEAACEELDSYFRKTHHIMTTRQLKAACGGYGSNETYLEYIRRWTAERVERTGVLSTVLSLHKQIESFTKTTDLLLGTLSDQLRMCPIEFSTEDEAGASFIESAADRGNSSVNSPTAISNEIAGAHAPEEDSPARIARLAGSAAQASEARFLDENAVGASEKQHRGEPTDGASPSARPTAIAPETGDASLSRDEMGSRQAALPLGTNQSVTDERETMHDRSAN